MLRVSSIGNFSSPFSRQETLYYAYVIFDGLVKYLLQILDMFNLSILVSLTGDLPIISVWLM